MMLVKDNLLFLAENTQSAFKESKNNDPDLELRYIIMHYTAGSSAAAAIEKLCDDQVTNRVSAHLVISRTGEITQLVPFDRIAWHAGVSYWENERAINRISIGIELDNEGWYRQENGIWLSSFDTPADEADLDVLTHPKLAASLGWRKFPPVQWQAALEVCQALRAAYPQIEGVLGHEDIHQDKTDPGPSFRLDQFRAALFADPTQPTGETQALAAKVKKFRTDGVTTIYQNECRDEKEVIVRYGPPPVLPPRHPASPLPDKTRVKVVRTQPQVASGVKWSLVEVRGNLPGFNQVKGWVKADLVKEGKVKGSAELYIDTGSPPKRETPQHPAKSLPAGIPLRRLETRPGWVFVCTLDKITSHGYVYAWLRESDIVAA